MEAINRILELLPASGPLIEFQPTTKVIDELPFEDFVIRRRESGTIEVERAGVVLSKAMPVLRDIANKLGVPLVNGRGNDLNTRQLGAEVLRALAAG